MSIFICRRWFVTNTAPTCHRGKQLHLRLTEQTARSLCRRVWTKDERAHVRGLLVVIDVVDVPRQAKVGYFHHVVLRHQNVASGEISVDALRRYKHALSELASCLPSCDIGGMRAAGLPSWRTDTPCRGPLGKRRTRGLWWTCSPREPGPGCSSTPCPAGAELSSTPASCPWMRTRLSRTEDLKTQEQTHHTVAYRALKSSFCPWVSCLCSSVSVR